jgi:hypothetical protein
MSAKVHPTRPPREPRAADRDYDSLDELLDAIKERYGWTTDYQLQKHMGWTTSKLGNWRSARSIPNDHELDRIAERLGLNTFYVMGIVRAEREQNARPRALWKYLARATKDLAPLAVIGLIAATAPPPSAPSVQLNAGANIHYAQWLKDRRRRWQPRFPERRAA